MVPHIAVVGAGVIGLSTAVLAQEKIPGLRVTIISERFSPHTTGDISAGLWKPYCVKDTPPSDILRWCSKTYAHMLKLWQSVDADDAGVCLIAKYELSVMADGPDTNLPSWSDVPMAYLNISREQVNKLMGQDKYTGGALFMTFTLEPSRYLPYLTNKFLLNGGKIQQRRVEKLQDLCGQYDVVINCTGVHAHHLVGDEDVVPIRGQVLRMKAPWMFHMISEHSHDGNYIIPNIDCVILGGTQQEGDWNTTEDPDDSRSIFQGCCKIIPALKGAEILKEQAGLRPSRSKIRLERESITDIHGNIMEVIHNYGHGGSGVTLSWGCAHDAVDILQGIINTQHPSMQLKSKL